MPPGTTPSTGFTNGDAGWASLARAMAFTIPANLRQATRTRAAIRSLVPVRK